MHNIPAAENRLQRSLALTIKPRRIHSLKNRQIPGQLPQSLPQLQFRSHRIPLPMMVKPDREVNQRLQKVPLGSARGPPHILENLVALVELARVKQLYAAPAFCFRYHSSVTRSPSSNE